MKNKTILVVEDERAILEVLISTLIMEGINTLGAEDGEKGLKLALKEHPDLILLDILMPKMDGITMLKKLRQDSWGKTVSVIILTNLIDMEKIAEAIEDGVYDYLVKTDWKLEDVIKRVKEKIGP